MVRFKQKIRSSMTNNIFTEFGDDPLELFRLWFADAAKNEPSDHNVMALATADARGKPSVRMVLLKEFNERGFVFYTNLQSGKGRDLLENPQAELNFHWKSLERQVRISGTVEEVSDAESDSYFASRSRESQIGALASAQSEKLESYKAYEENAAELAEKFAGQTVPRPAHWGGFRLKPERIEFWIAHPHRLHKRFVYTKKNDEWDATWLYP